MQVVNQVFYISKVMDPPRRRGRPRGPTRGRDPIRRRIPVRPRNPPVNNVHSEEEVAESHVVQPLPLVAEAIVGPTLADKTKDIVRLGAQPFRGGIDAIEADKWINNLATYFTMVECTEIEKAKVAAFLLKDEARIWWDSLGRGGLDAQNLNWAGFKEAYHAKYFPSGVKRQLEADFDELVQGSMTVRQYEARFAELYRFCREMDVESLARRFESGLNARIRSKIVPLELGTVAAVLSAAVASERDDIVYKKEQNALRDSQGKGKAVAESSDPTRNNARPWKRQNNQNNRNFNANRAAGPIRAVPVQQVAPVTCFNCHEVGHTSKNCTKPKNRICFNCGQEGHVRKDCNQPRRVGQGDQQRQQPQGQARVFAIGQNREGVEGTLSVFNYLARVLFDTGASHSFISSSVVVLLGLTPKHLVKPLCVTSPLGVSAMLDLVCEACPIDICGRDFLADLIILPDNTYDVILGVNWLRQNHAVIDYFEMVVSFHIPGRTVFRYRCLKADTAWRSGFLAFVESGSNTAVIAEIAVVSEYEDVFQKIPSLPPRRVVDFAIDVIPGTGPISKAPYRMAPLECSKDVSELWNALRM